MKSVLARLSIALASLLFALVVAELAARAFHLLPHWRQPVRYLVRDGERVPVGAAELRMPGSPLFRPGLVYETCYDTRFGARRATMDERGCVPSVLNAHGWRGPDVPFERTGAVRFIAVGDSLTYGEGVPYECTWPAVLARELEQELGRSDPARAVEVVDLAVPAVNLPEIRAIVESFVPPYHADLVVYAFFLNDAWLPGTNVKASIGAERRIQSLVGDEPAGLAGYCELWRGFLLWRARRVEREAAPHLQVYDPASDNWQRCAAHLRAIRAAIEGSGARFLVAILPEVRPAPDRYPFTQVHAWLHEWFTAEGIAWVDLLDAPWIAPEALRVHPTDLHPNEIGHRCIADALLPAVLARVQR